MTYLFTIIDRFTRRPEAVPLPDAHASTCATALLHLWVARFGVPEDINSDRGRQFTFSLWTQLYNLLGVEANTRNPCHDVVFEAPLSDFSADSKSEPNLAASTFEHIKNAKINLKTIANLHVQCPPPCEEHRINVDISLIEQKKKKRKYQRDGL
ncbi:Gag-Pol polyprotein [Plakobranchus ocellatus]|uniref:Gag-Pol polyprotein n=1 Tax=Plakobranchus ocellatus TaxID=259542 RepID=A0AAV4E0C7_9GAST|nr:Gag-Pol polyprotein [Plakobranchus ocellatus]